MSRPTLVFLHLPKTGGSTLASIIRRSYHPRELYEVYGEPPDPAIEAFATMAPERRAHYRAVIGHLNLGLRDLVPGPVTMVTMLRHPVDRALSTYYSIRERSSHPLNRTLTDPDMSLARALERGLTTEFDNLQTRVLSTEGIEDPVPYGACTAAMLETARRNLEERFAVVGVTGRFDETLLLMQEAAGWEGVFYRRRNATRERPSREEVPEETRAAIREHNRLDLALFDWVTERLELRIEEGGSAFRERLESFRRLNAAGGPLGRMGARVRALMGGS